MKFSIALLAFSSKPDAVGSQKMSRKSSGYQVYTSYEDPSSANSRWAALEMEEPSSVSMSMLMQQLASPSDETMWSFDDNSAGFALVGNSKASKPSGVSFTNPTAKKTASPMFAKAEKVASSATKAEKVGGGNAVTIDVPTSSPHTLVPNNPGTPAPTRCDQMAFFYYEGACTNGVYVEDVNLYGKYIHH